MRLPPLNALRAFEAAARHENFARAAAELNLTPSAVSHQIRRLEALLGAPLFDRAAKGLTLNDSGRRYHAVVRDAFGRLAEGTAAIFGVVREDRLRISCMPALAAFFLIPRLARFQAAHPGLEVALDTTERFAVIGGDGEDGVDVGLRYGPGPQGELFAEVLFTDRTTPVCSPRLLTGLERPAPADVTRFTQLHDKRTEAEWRAWLTAAGVPLDRVGQRLRFDTTAAAYHAAEAGLGFAMGWPGLLRDTLAAGTLVAPFPDMVLPRALPYYLVCAKGQERHGPVAAFRAWIRSELEAVRLA